MKMRLFLFPHASRSSGSALHCFRRTEVRMAFGRAQEWWSLVDARRPSSWWSRGWSSAGRAWSRRLAGKTASGPRTAATCSRQRRATLTAGPPASPLRRAACRSSRPPGHRLRSCGAGSTVTPSATSLLEAAAVASRKHPKRACCTLVLETRMCGRKNYILIQRNFKLEDALENALGPVWARVWSSWASLGGSPGAFPASQWQL